MCGIAGIVSLNGKPINLVRERSKKMMDMLNHRGPDYGGVWVDDSNSISLVNTRLSIVDIRNKFKVPYISSTKKSVITYNGEIYNYKQLARDLQYKGIDLVTNSDTEVMLRGIDRLGLPFLEMVDGFWSFAHYDIENMKLILSRDLMGEKGLFCFQNEEELVFCSEVEPIIAVGKQDYNIDFTSLISSFGLRAAPSKKSLIKNIGRLLGGHSIFIDLKNGRIKNLISQKFSFGKWLEFFKSKPSEKKVLDVYDENLYKAITARVPEEVSFSSTLSGGIDSAIIGIYASNFSKRSIDTIYAHSSNSPPITKGDNINEYEASLISSKSIGSSHLSFSMLNEAGCKNYISAAKNSFDGVFCEGLPSFACISEKARSTGKKVLLLSDGPDDCLGGYELDRILCEDVIKRPNKMNEKRKVNLQLYKNFPFYFRPIHGGTTSSAMKKIFSPNFLKFYDPIFGSLPKNKKFIYENFDISQKMALSYAFYSLPDYFNTRIDRGSMMHSIESRVPLQAPSIVNMMIGTPYEWRYKYGYTKYIFRKLVERYIGKNIAFRNKYGFASPIWKKQSLYKSLNMRSIVRDSELFNENVFNKSTKDFFIKDNKRHLWMAYCAAQTYSNLQSLNKVRLNKYK